MNFNFRMNEVIWVLSGAIDYVGITDINHGKRVAWYAREINRYLGLDWSEDDLVVASLLHDCGVSSTDVHERLVHEFEWDKVSAHCERGGQLMASFEPFVHLAPVVALHHTAWSDLVAREVPQKIRELANLIFLADRFDVLVSTNAGEILIDASGILKRLADMSPRLFNPGAISALHRAARTDAFWLIRSGDALDFQFRGWRNAQVPRSWSHGELLPLFDLFSSCVDGKSRYTADHSRGVRNLAMYLGVLAGLGGDTVHKLGIAGLLHDLGKLRVPDSILEKPGALDSKEYAVIRHHSYDTHDILARIPGFEDIAAWAACHHEKVDGSGYPFRLKGGELSMEARIVAVADIFQALVQNRPYRHVALQEAQIRKIMADLADSGKTDPLLTDRILAHYDTCVSSALLVPGKHGQGQDQLVP